MQINIIKNLMLLLIVSLWACIEPYAPNVEKYENILVINGMITNLPGPYTVKLSRASSVDKPEFIPVNNSLVQIFCDDGTVATLSELGNGEYQTIAGEITGQVGRSYKLHIETLSGEILETDYATIKKPVEIDTLYTEFESFDDVLSGTIKSGYRLFANAKIPSDGQSFMIWKGIETYEYNSSFTIDYIYNYGFNENPNPDSLYTCWKTQPINDILTLDMRNAQQTDINVKLNFVTHSKFAIKYSILMKQMVVDEDTYLYWNRLKLQNEQEGSFYTQQPYQIQGNVYNTQKPEEPVLGYFTVGGASQKRIFYSDPAYEPTICEPNFDGLGFIIARGPDYWPFFITFIDSKYATSNTACFDCRLQGGVLEKPDFWED